MWARYNDIRKYQIDYLNSAPAVTIRKIVLEFPESEELIELELGNTIKIYPSSVHWDPVLLKCKELFPTRIRVCPRTHISIEINYNDADFALLKKLFDHLNKNYIGNEFPTNLVTELQNIFSLDPFKRDSYQHSYTQMKYPFERSNPDKKNSTELLRILDGNFNLDRFSEELAHGENPNQQSETGESVTYRFLSRPIKIKTKDIEEEKKIIKHTMILLINYGVRFLDAVNRLIVSESTFESPFEYAYKFRNDGHKLQICFELMSNAINYLSKPVSEPQYKLKYYECYFNSKGIPVTHFQFYSNKSITTYLIEDELEAPIKQILWNIFRNCYKAQKEKTVRAVFDEVIEPKRNRLVELIYTQLSEGTQKLIGFNLFEFLKVHDYDVLHCVFTGVDERYESLNLMMILIYRLGFSLQLLYPNNKIGVHYDPMLFKIYSMLRVNTDIEHYPMQQPDHAPAFVDSMLGQIYKDGEMTVYHQGITWCIKEENHLKVAESRYKYDQNNPFQQFYDIFISRPNMYPICFWPVSDKAWANFAAATDRLGLGALPFVGAQAKLIAPKMEKLGVKTSKPSGHASQLRAFCDASILFWKNKRVASKSVTRYKEPALRSSLG